MGLVGVYGFRGLGVLGLGGLGGLGFGMVWGLWVWGLGPLPRGLEFRIWSSGFRVVVERPFLLSYMVHSSLEDPTKVPR